jgi:hypothetical protein
MSQPAPMVDPLPPGASMDQRDADDRHLDQLGLEFQNIDVHGAHARSRLKAVEEKVESFRQQLYSRSYNAMDILHDAENLQQRIHAAREGTRAPVALAPTNAPPPSMTSPPPPNAQPQMISPPPPQ